MASLGDIKIKIEPEMTDTAKAILRDMIVTELKVVFPDTIKPFEMLREEMRVMVKEEIDAYFQHSMNVVRTQVGHKHE
mgnify:CR=1 FL=1